MADQERIVVVGGGLVGSILSIFLQQRGHRVRLFEKRPDMRKELLDGGRSINLVVTSRGIHALEQVGLKDEILELTIPVFGRMMHDLQGELTYQSYSKDDSECNYSVSRAELNKCLLSCAERQGVEVHFERELLSVDFQTGELVFSGETTSATRIFGTDGAGSATRILLAKAGHLEDSVEFLKHGYKELLIPAGPESSYPIEKNALHIWPRGTHMLMALPNLDGSFTVTLYLAHEGEESFASLQDEAQVLAFFQKYYPDSIPLMPHLAEEFFANPTGLLGTVRSYPWHFEDKVALLGDACHAVVPFFGQGMNAGFEDCSVLAGLMDQHGDDWSAVFAAYSKAQKPNGDAIADMALENFIEMRDRVGDEAFLLQKQVEARVGQAFPELYLSRYSMVTHSLIPYSIAQKAGLIQSQILQELCAGISAADEADMDKARALIVEKLQPFLEQHQVRW